MPRGEPAGGSKTIYLPRRYLIYVDNHIENFGDYIKTKLDEDMVNDVSLLEQRVKDIDFEKSQLKDKIKMVKEKEKVAKQKLEGLIEKAQGRIGTDLKNWAEGWRSEILSCGETVGSFVRIVEGRKAKA